jgi:HEAT repeat protein
MANVFGKTLLRLVAASIAAGSLAAQDPESLFAEGIKALRLNNREEALAKFQQVLAADPSHEQAFEIWRKTDQDMWRWLMLEQGDIQKVAQELQSRARLRRKDMSRDQAAIDGLVEIACAPDKTFGERRQALSQLAADHSEFAVPALVKKLGDNNDSKAQDLAILALHDLGTAATLPLLEAMNSDNPLVRRNVAAALSHIGDERAVPALQAAASNDRSEEVRYVAAQASKRMNVRGTGAVEGFLAIAERYLSGRDGGAPAEVVWDLKDGELTPVDVPAAIFPLRAAQKFAHAAWRSDPASSAAMSTYARSLLAEAAAIEAATAAAGDAAPDSLKNLANAPAELRITALSLGPAVLRTALADARSRGSAPVAVECAKLLGSVEGRAGLEGSALVQGLQDDDKRVAYACALALYEASGGSNVPAAPDVVRVLGNAATEESLRTILVVDGSEGVRKTAVEAFSQGRGTVVEAAAGGTQAVGTLFTFPVVDAVVINQDLPDVVPEHVIGLIRKDPRLANTKIVVVANDPDAAATRFGDRINGVIKGPLTGDALTAKVNEVLADVDLGPKRKWAEDIASSASAALAALAHKGVDLGGATKQLSAQLNRADGVAIPVAKALASSGTTADVDALLAALSGSGSVDLKKAAADAMGAILHRAGKAPADVVEKLTASMNGADASLRMAIAGALGRAGLASGEQLKLIDAIAAASGGDAAKGEAAKAEEAKAGGQ